VKSERRYITEAEYWFAQATQDNRTPEGANAYANIAMVALELAKVAHRYETRASKFEATRQLGAV
jgi:Tfp pilus assembly protein PilF